MGLRWGADSEGVRMGLQSLDSEYMEHMHTVLVQSGSPLSGYGSGYCKSATVCVPPTHTHHTGDARQQHEASLAAELQALSAAVDATPPDVVTRPGEGLGVPSPGFKALGRMELLVSCLAACVCVCRGVQGSSGLLRGGGRGLEGPCAERGLAAGSRAGGRGLTP